MIKIKKFKLTKSEIISYSVFGVVLFSRLFIIDLAHVKGESMQPTIHDKDIAITNKATTEYSHGDIVTLKSSDEKSIYIKRIIALPNDHLVIKDGYVYINDIKQDEAYLDKFTYTSGDVDLIIPNGYYYVLGDNRGNSKDSRVFGVVEKSKILSKVMIHF